MKTASKFTILALVGTLGIGSTATAHSVTGLSVVTQQGTPTGDGDDAGWAECPERPGFGAMWNMPTPGSWGPKLQCQDVTVDADPSDPASGEATIKAARIAAGKPDQKIGTLVVNYGPSGTSSIFDAQDMWELLPYKVTDQFDILAIDSRVAGAKEQCFKSSSEQWSALGPMTTRPKNRGQRLKRLSSAQEFAQACANNVPAGQLKVSSETYAHDLEATRKALGIESLNIYASEGHGLAGQHFVNLYPDSARSVIIDGVIDGQRVAKAGAKQGSHYAKETGLYQASKDTLKKLFDRCDAAGPTKCHLAQPHDKFPTAQSKLDEVMRVASDEGIYDRITFEGYDENDELVEEFVIDIDMDEHTVIDIVSAGVSGDFVSPAELDEILHSFWLAAIGEAPEPVAIRDSGDIAGHKAALKRLTDRDLRLQSSQSSVDDDYDRLTEAEVMVQCNDSQFTGDVFKAAAGADALARKSPIFGAELGWLALDCNAWGPSKTSRNQSFNANTKNPVMFVNAQHSSWYNHKFAKEAVGRYPNAVLVTDEGWTNASYGFGGCVDNAVHAYLVDPNTATSITCPAMAAEPFTDDLPAGSGSEVAGQTGMANRDTVAGMLAQMPEQRLMGSKRPMRYGQRVSKKQ